MGHRRGDRVTASKMIFGMNVPPVPAGTPGTVVKTTLLGRPKKVSFPVRTGWGEAAVKVEVDPGDVD
jgi:hypothetical protein